MTKVYVKKELLIPEMHRRKVYCVPVVMFEPSFDPFYDGLGWHEVDCLSERPCLKGDDGSWLMGDLDEWLSTGFGVLTFDREVSSLKEVGEILTRTLVDAISEDQFNMVKTIVREVLDRERKLG